MRRIRGEEEDVDALVHQSYLTDSYLISGQCNARISFALKVLARWFLYAISVSSESLWWTLGANH
jgi:hypothetical protein